MANINTNAEISAVRFHEQATKPAQPATGYWKIYFKSDGLYTEDDAGTEVQIMLGAGVPLSTVTATGDLIVASGSATVSRLAMGTAGKLLVARAGTPAWEEQFVSIPFIVDGGGTVITAGIKGDIQIDYACVPVAITTLADAAGDLVVDIWRDTYANFPPTNDDSMTASAPPTLAGVAKATDTTLTGWHGTINAGDILRYNVDSAGTVQRATVSLKVKRI